MTDDLQSDPVPRRRPRRLTAASCGCVMLILVVLSAVLVP